MKNKPYVSGALCSGALLSLAFAPGALGQAVPNTPPAAAPQEEEILELSPFEVTSEGSTGYTSNQTLAGTRVRTDLRDVAAVLTVVTPQFLQDTHATSNSTLLPYQTSTEVGGTFGNFAGVGNTQGVSETGKLVKPSNETRVRGLDSADNTRDYFVTNIPWDSYNVDRIELQRGPNSILFGTGSPAGIINTTTVGAQLNKSGGKIENSLGSNNSSRTLLDYNQVIIKSKLAVRVAFVNDDKKFKQHPAFSHDKRAFAAIRYNEQLLDEKVGGPMTIRIRGEQGTTRSNNPRSLTPWDNITQVYDTSRFARVGNSVKTYDPYYSWNFDQQMDRATKSLKYFGTRPNTPDPIPGLGNDSGISNGLQSIYNNGSSFASSYGNSIPGTWYGVKADGTIDHGIGGFPFGRQQKVAGLYEYSQNQEKLHPGSFPAASKGFYKDLGLRDPSVFDFYNNLIDGNNKREWNDYKALNMSLSQNFLNNHLGLEFSYNREEVTSGQRSLFGDPSIGVDINSVLMNTVAGYAPANATPDWFPDTAVTAGTPNPNVGRAYITGSTPYAYSGETKLEDVRVTAFGELRGTDLFAKDSFLARLFTRNTLTALYQKSKEDKVNANWRPFAPDAAWATRQGQVPDITQGGRATPVTIYLSDNILGRTSAAGLNLKRVLTTVNPHGVQTGSYFDSHWNSTLNPSAVWTNPFDGSASTQSENPANYGGWKTTSVNLLNADYGDIDHLLTSVDKKNKTITSRGLTLQSFFLDDTIVPTFGWRRDWVRTQGRASAKDPVTNVSSFNFENDATPVTQSGDTKTWGIVARMPKQLRKNMPYGSDVSLFFNNSNNFKPDSRVGFDGELLPNQKGHSRDYGVVLSVLDERVTFKITKFETTVKDVTIDGGNPLGSNSWFLGNMQVWGAAAVQTIRQGFKNEAPGLEWFWDYGMVDTNNWSDSNWYDGTYGPLLAHPSTVKQMAAVADWVATMPSQRYFDLFQYSVDVSKMKSTDYATQKQGITGGWNIYNGIGALQPGNGGLAQGLNPVGTLDQASKGYEFELFARPTKNWDLTINAAKVNSTRTAIGASFSSWIEGQKKRLDGAAGDLRLWWGGDQTYRQYFDQFIYQQYLFQKESLGQSAPEIRPWRFNAITNYRFVNGIAKGFNIGGGYRWQDKQILGYHLDSTKSKLDVKNPIKGAKEDGLDVWIGYERQLTSKIKWRSQLNLTNVGEKAHLIKVSVNPDGTAAALRIADGTQWTLTNTLSF